MSRRRLGAAGLVIAAAVALVGVTGCSPAPEPAAPAAASAAGSAVALTDGYVKAVPKDGDMAMSAIFGTLTNATGAEITVVKASSDAASTVELHEMVMDGGAMKMRPKDGGFVIPARGTVNLDPGGLHIMLIGLTRDIKAGDTVNAELELSDGTTIPVTAIGRDMANANESYDPNADG